MRAKLSLPPSTAAAESRAICYVQAVLERSGFPAPLTAIAIAGLGSTNCGGVGYTVPRGGVLGYNEQGYRGDYYLLDAGKVTETLWTPNRLSYEVSASEPTSLVINQTLYPGWHLAHGEGLAYPENGLIAVRVPPGRQEIELLYTPHHIVAACAVALFALAVLIVVWWIEIRSIGIGKAHSEQQLS
jgi:hypothetical protein